MKVSLITQIMAVFAVVCIAISVVVLPSDSNEIDGGKKIVFLGDSLTYGAGLVEIEGMDREQARWTHLLCERIGAKEFNYGTTGTAMGAPAENAFLDRYSTMEKDADIVIVFGGTNDYWCGIVPMGEYDSTNRDDFCGAMNLLLSGLMERYAGKTIIFITPHTQNPDDQTHNSDVANIFGCTLSDYSDMIKNKCGVLGIRVMDLNDYVDFDIGHNDSDKAQYSYDGCHFNAEGHKEVSKAVYTYLKEEKLV